MNHALSSLLITALLTMFLPLLGALAAGTLHPAATEFPPRTIYIVHAPYSPVAMILFTVFIAAAVIPPLLRVLRFRGACHSAPPERRPLPRYGYAAAVLLVISWIAAWTRFDLLAPIQHYTFFPLWLGYIFIVAALAERRGSPSSRPIALLFFVSAAFWWMFEYLNRFVQNWEYRNVEHFSAPEYFIHATLCFSTVLPAVFVTRRLAATLPRVTDPFRNFAVVSFTATRWFGPALAAVGVAALVLLSRYPDHLFPFVWVAPLLIAAGSRSLLDREWDWLGLRYGDWRFVTGWSAAGLICGLFWEMWNYSSLARWVYHIPYVEAAHLFEMPLLGYAGYLPFGILCGVVSQAVHPRASINA